MQLFPFKIYGISTLLHTQVVNHGFDHYLLNIQKHSRYHQSTSKTRRTRFPRALAFCNGYIQCFYSLLTKPLMWTTLSFRPTLYINDKHDWKRERKVAVSARFCQLTYTYKVTKSLRKNTCLLQLFGKFKHKVLKGHVPHVITMIVEATLPRILQTQAYLTLIYIS